MNIFIQIKNSVYSKEYYQSTVLKQPFRESIKYLAKLALLLALLGVIIFAFTIPKIASLVKKEVASVVSTYPDDLKVSINNGVTSINRPEPYFVKLPTSIKDTKGSKNTQVDNLITVNTTESFNLDKFKEYSTLLLLTQKELVFIDDNGGVKVLPVSNFGNIEITKAWVLDKEAALLKLLPWLGILLLALSYIGLFLVEFAGTLIILFFYAVIAWAILKMKGLNITYGKSYQVALHASTLILFISIVGNYLKPINNFWVKIIILAFIVYLNFSNISTINDKKELNTAENSEIKA